MHCFNSRLDTHVEVVVVCRCLMSLTCDCAVGLVLEYDEYVSV